MSDSFSFLRICCNLLGYNKKISFLRCNVNSYIKIQKNTRHFGAFPKCLVFYDLCYANAAVMIAIEYTSDALQPRDRSLIGAFSPNRIGP